MHRFLLPLLALVLASCATFSEKTQGLQLGMSEAQVKDRLGSEYQVKASKYAADGQPVEVWQFQDPKSNEIYWVYFKGGKLVQWGTPEAIKSIPDLQGPGAPAPQ